MMKIAHVEEVNGLRNVPKELHRVLLKISGILDGENRDVN